MTVESMLSKCPVLRFTLALIFLDEVLSEALVGCFNKTNKNSTQLKEFSAAFMMIS